MKKKLFLETYLSIVKMVAQVNVLPISVGDHKGLVGVQGITTPLWE